MTESSANEWSPQRSSWLVGGEERRGVMHGRAKGGDATARFELGSPCRHIFDRCGEFLPLSSRLRRLDPGAWSGKGWSAGATRDTCEKAARRVPTPNHASGFLT